jgi:hypothetical protein
MLSLRFCILCLSCLWLSPASAEPGKLEINFLFDAASDFSAEAATVVQVKQGRPQVGLIDKQGNWLLEPEKNRKIHDFNNGLAPIMEGTRWGFVDESGRLTIAPRFDKVLRFYQGLAAALDNGKWGYINRKGEWQIPARFEQAQAFSESMAAVRKAGQWGFIDRNGNWLIEPRFEDASMFKSGLSAVKTGAELRE